MDRLVGVFDREHIVEAVRGKENPRQEHGHFLGKYHDLWRTGRCAGIASLQHETKTVVCRYSRMIAPGCD